MNTFSRNIPLLSLCQALMMSATTLIITTSALVGAMLADDKSLATLPLAVQFIAVMLTIIPASFLMEKIGRRKGFMLAALVGITAGIVTSYAITIASFWLFTLGTFLIGVFNGFGGYYRFTAADIVKTPLKSRAISWVMVGGLIAAFVGPNLANYTKELMPNALFAGSYASLIAIYILSLLTASFLALPQKAVTNDNSPLPQARPLWKIVKQPKFIVAMICAMLGYGVMSFVMTATPLAMQHHHHTFDSTAIVIQWHVVAMFAPSFFTGDLIKRFGVDRIIFMGGLLGLLCVALNLLGTSVTHFWLALFALGLSWNFLFIGGTSLLTETYADHEKAKAQAVNDFSVFTVVAIGSLTAGYLQHHYGWRMVNIGVVPALLIILLSISWLHLKLRNDKSKPLAACRA